MKRMIIFGMTIASALALCSCSTTSNNDNKDKESNYEPFVPTEVESSESEDLPSFDVDDTKTSSESFVTTSDGVVSYDSTSNTYTITKAGTYDLAGNLVNGMVLVNCTEDEDVVLNLNGVYMTSTLNSPIFVASAGNVDISAKKNTENKIYDLRTEDVESSDTVGSAAIYSTCDLKLKGTGELQVMSSANNGIHTKDDLKIQKETLYVKAYNNAIKGNDSITIESGDITAISLGGDGLKTNNSEYKSDGVTQKGGVTITAGTINIYSKNDGIDSCSDVNISGDANINIYTADYSSYTDDDNTITTSKLYVMMPASIYSSGYKYSVYSYDTDGTGQWAEGKYAGTTTVESQGGGMQRPGMNMQTTYYCYEFDVNRSYKNMALYAYSSSQSTNQSNSYTAYTSGTYNDMYNAITIRSISSGRMSAGWSSFGSNGLSGSSKGIKADNTCTISGGIINIKSTDDGIHVNNDEILESTGTNGLGNLTINGGQITITSNDDGIHADQDININDGYINVKESYEGIESNRMYINGGTVYVYASDDGLNATATGKYTPVISVSGGYTDVAVPNGDTDTIDSNGTFTMSAGFLVIKNGRAGSSNTGGTFDTDRGVTVTGGTVVSCGCIDQYPAGAYKSTSQTLTAGEYTIGSKYKFTLSQSYTGFFIYSSEIKSGTVTNGTTTITYTL